MPNYTIKNTKTGETDTMFCKYEDLKAYLAENPDWQTVISAPQIVSGVGSVKDAAGKLPDGFKDKLREIKKKHPDSTGVDHLI